MSLFIKASDLASKLVISCLCLSLIACEPVLFGGVASLGDSSSSGVTQCESGPADLSGVCRSSTPTMGALEANEAGTTTAVSNETATQLVQSGSTLNIAWSPYPGIAAGYFVYYGPTVDTAITLASDLQIGIANFNPSAPSISYETMLDLGLNIGNAVCFRILAYDSSLVPYDWSEVQCTIV